MKIPHTKKIKNCLEIGLGAYGSTHFLWRLMFKKTISIESGSKVTGNINELESTTAKIFKLQRKSLDKEEN